MPVSRLLSTKLYLPPLRPNLISRPRLIERLNKGLHQRPGLILISAPAGFGKTTLVCEWLRQSDLRAAWISLDETDNDPNRFLTYLTAALQQVDPNIGQIAPGIFQASPSAAPPEALLTDLINEIAASASPFVLALDDYHLIKAQQIHAALTFLLEHLPLPTGPDAVPQGMHIVITCRADPPLPLARWRGRGQLTELREADLRFTAGEATAFFNEMSRVNLSSGQVEALASRTEGWITGLHLAALSMQNHVDIAGFVNDFTGSHRYILDYLTDEVLSRQPEAVQHFLVRTSILEQLSGPLCDAVVSRGSEASGSRNEDYHSPLFSYPTVLQAVGPPASSQEILEYLEAANLFVIPLDDERRWYRYHHLLADLLRHRLRQNFLDQIPALHRRAGEWYEQHGLPAEAVGHALAAEEFERAAALIERTGWDMLERCEMTSLLGWLDALPDQVARSRPQLGILRAWALAISGQWDGVEACLSSAALSSVESQTAAIRAYIAGVRGDVPRTIELAQQALDQLPKGKPFLGSRVALSLGIAYFSKGEPIAASRALSEAITLSQAGGQTYMTFAALMTLGHVQIMQGSLRSAAQTFRDALGEAATSGAHPLPVAGMAYVGLAELHYEWNDLDDALRDAVEGIRLTELGGFTSYLLAGYIRLAKVYLAQGDVARALEVTGKAEQLVQKHDYAYMQSVIARLRVRLWVTQGNLAAASRWAQACRLSPDDGLNLAREVEQIAVAQVLIAQGNTDEAQRLLARLLQAAEVARRVGRVIEIMILQALTFDAQRDLKRALSTLEQALTLAEPEGYLRTFVDEGPGIARLLRQAVSQSLRPDYAGRLLAVLNETGLSVSSAAQSLVEPLTDRELEVLGLVAAGLSNREIAEELYLSINTVKVHTKNIYGKLNVRGRIQAVDRARELGLL